jgi:hypothetical protein
VAASRDMHAHRKTAVVVGILFVIATAMLFVGGAIYDPILSASDYLEQIYPQRVTVIVGILVEFTKAPAVALIAVCLFPLLRERDEILALGYVGFRFLEAILLMIIDINRLSLVNLSQAYLGPGGADASYFQNTGRSIQAVNDWTFSIYLLIFTLGALMFYAALYRSRLIPRSISGWGFVAAALLLAGSVLIMTDTLAGMSTMGLELIFAAPIAANEMVLALWLILKGFSPAAIASGPAATDRG